MKRLILKTLRFKIQGDVISSKEFREFYSVDASSYKIIPSVIVIPKNEQDVIATVKIAREMNTSVTVRGAGTGLVGGALNTGIILDMRNFDSVVLESDHVKVGTGVMKGRLDKILEKEKKFFPPNPSVGAFCSVGGMLANNSSGSRSLKYGSVIDNVYEITFIDGNAKKITLPENAKTAKMILNIAGTASCEKFPKVTKNSSGYRLDKIKTTSDSHKVMIGSEGTLGIILAAKLKTRPNPKRRILYVLKYDSITKAAVNCKEINKTKPSAIEFIDKNIADQIKYEFGKNQCLLFVEYDEEIVSSEKKFKSIITGEIIKRLYKKDDIKRWWRFRDSALHYSLKSISIENRVPHVIEDAAVPLDSLPKLFAILKKINAKYRTKSVVYGHAGNGNVHVRLISDGKKIRIKDLATEYFEEIIKLGGTITAEHGDGLARSEFVKKQYGAENYQSFQKIKDYFDPAGVLNPGKVITTQSTILKNLDMPT